jgi:predicted TIM-barrel fold metal-dependent hydrolase
MYRTDGPVEMQPVGETEFVNGVAAMCAAGTYGPSRICAGIVSHADLLLAARVEPVLEAHARAAGPRFKGIRHSTAMDPDPRMKYPAVKPPHDLMMTPQFRDGFGRLAKFGLTFDAWLYFTQLPQLIDLARKFPETTIVLNHVGGVLGVGPYEGRRDELFAGWKKNIEELATCANVVVKTGGLGMRNGGFGFDTQPKEPSSADLAKAWKPYIETCIAAFGVQRCMFESNFPVDKVSCSYPVLWNAFKRLAAGYSADEKTALFSGTAKRIYRL